MPFNITTFRMLVCQGLEKSLIKLDMLLHAVMEKELQEVYCTQKYNKSRLFWFLLIYIKHIIHTCTDLVAYKLPSCQVYLSSIKTIRFVYVFFIIFNLRDDSNNSFIAIWIHSWYNIIESIIEVSSKFTKSLVVFCQSTNITHKIHYFHYFFWHEYCAAFDIGMWI